MDRAHALSSIFESKTVLCARVRACGWCALSPVLTMFDLITTHPQEEHCTFVKKAGGDVSNIVRLMYEIEQEKIKKVANEAGVAMAARAGNVAHSEEKLAETPAV